MSDHINSIIQLYRVWVLYLYSKIIQSEYCIYWIQYSDWLFFKYEYSKFIQSEHCIYWI